MSTCQKQYKQIFDGHEKECYTLDINAKTGGKAMISSNDQMNQVEKNQVDQRASQYADIIDLPHHVSKRHPQMALSDRAAQFGAYAALRGYDEAVTETVKKSIHQTEAYIEMEQYND